VVVAPTLNLCLTWRDSFAKSSPIAAHKPQQRVTIDMLAFLHRGSLLNDVEVGLGGNVKEGVAKAED
jgi:hypothetical protein